MKIAVYGYLCAQIFSLISSVTADYNPSLALFLHGITIHPERNITSRQPQEHVGTRAATILEFLTQFQCPWKKMGPFFIP